MTSIDDFDVLARLLHRRHSCRAFLDTQLSRARIEQLLTLAQRTASWCNAQPWQVIVTGGAETDRLRQALKQAAGQPPSPDFPFPERYEGVYQDRRRACGFALYDSVSIARGDRAASASQAARNFDFFGAPHVAIITAPAAMGTYAAVDCGAYVSTFLLAATSLGLAAIAQAAPAARSDVLHAHFGIGDDRRVVCAISFGLADTTHPANAFRTERAAVQDAAILLLGQYHPVSQ